MRPKRCEAKMLQTFKPKKRMCLKDKKMLFFFSNLKWKVSSKQGVKSHHSFSDGWQQSLILGSRLDPKFFSFRKVHHGPVYFGQPMVISAWRRSFACPHTTEMPLPKAMMPNLRFEWRSASKKAHDSPCRPLKISDKLWVSLLIPPRAETNSNWEAGLAKSGQRRGRGSINGMYCPFVSFSESPDKFNSPVGQQEIFTSLPLKKALEQTVVQAWQDLR